MHTKEEKLAAFSRLLDIQERLRKECPWDRKQTNESLRPNTIEEAFELTDALLKNDTKNICKELGDVLEHVITSHFWHIKSTGAQHHQTMKPLLSPTSINSY